MSQQKVRCAVIGLGMGVAHISGYAAAPEGEVVAAVDTNPDKFEHVSQYVPRENCFTDYREMLAKVKPDVVSVCTPNALHAEMSIACLNAGCHVLCEKPMAMNVAEARHMKQAAEANGRLLGVNLSFRFRPETRALKDLADDGLCGEIYHGYTRWTRRDGFPGFGGWFGQKKLSGGGPLIDLGVHRIDLALWLMGGPRPLSVSGSVHHRIGVARGKQLGMPYDVEDYACGIVRLENEASLVFEASWAGFQGTQEAMETRVIGTKGGLRNWNHDGEYGMSGEYFTYRHGHHLSGTVAVANADFRNAYGEFVRSVAENRPYLATADDGIRIQQVLEALYQSAETGVETPVA